MARARREIKQVKPGKLIYCQGKVTEPAYFKQLRREYRIANLKIQCESLDPVKLVETAYAYVHNKGEDNFQFVYIVIDQDETSHAKLDQAIKECKQLTTKDIRYELIVSQECFEYWMLAHNQQLPSNIGRKQVSSELSKLKWLNNKHIEPIFFEQKVEATKNNITHLNPNSYSTNNEPSSAIRYLLEQVFWK